MHVIFLIKKLFIKYLCIFYFIDKNKIDIGFYCK